MDIIDQKIVPYIALVSGAVCLMYAIIKKTEDWIDILGVIVTWFVGFALMYAGTSGINEHEKAKTHNPQRVSGAS